MDSSQSWLLMPRCCGVDIEELSITRIEDHLKRKSFTSRELTQCYLKRIGMVNPRAACSWEKQICPSGHPSGRAITLKRSLPGEARTATHTTLRSIPEGRARGVQAQSRRTCASLALGLRLMAVLWCLQIVARWLASSQLWALHRRWALYPRRRVWTLWAPLDDQCKMRQSS